jgi:diguanylate cyclase (GGDEF)-like protein
MTTDNQQLSRPEPRRPKLSIRARLVILALLAVGPLMFDRVRLLENSRSERVELASSELLDFAQHAVQAQREMTASIRAVLQVLARDYVAASASLDTCNRSLFDLANNIPWIRWISIIGANGRVACAIDQKIIGVDVSDRAYFREATRTKNFVLSDYIVARVKQAPTLIAAYPAQNVDPAKNAVIAAAVDLEWVNKLMASLVTRPGSTMFLVDSVGTIVAGDTSMASWIGKAIDDTPLKKAVLTGEAGTVNATAFDRGPSIFAFVEVPSTKARLVVGVAESDILGRIDRDIRTAYVQLFIFTLLVLVAAWFVGEHLIVAPIRALAKKATQFGRGDLDVQPGKEAWATEFVPLVTALDDMAAKLAERERELREANEHLSTLVSVDGLLGLANRRGFDGRFTAEWQRASKLRSPVALMMIDVDHFKLYNDNFGHVLGDNCLRQIGDVLASIAVEHSAFPARYGGEEFALLLPGADQKTAVKVADQLRRTVETLNIVHPTAPTHSVTVSIGVASLVPRPGDDPGSLIEAADAGLYAAKRRGRNAVVAHTMTALPKAV